MGLPQHDDRRGGRRCAGPPLSAPLASAVRTQGGRLVETTAWEVRGVWPSYDVAARAAMVFYDESAVVYDTGGEQRHLWATT